ncbi:hypothetical protein [Brevundimonas diminuta]|uniref:hypothetical protein n=1 Tax=Brevundimonas diminuta TaxID=293 RepID=UPI003F804806
MPSGLIIRDAAGRVTLDTNTITSRPLGSLVISSPAKNVAVDVAVAAGKALWVFFYVVGGMEVFIRKHPTVTNRFVYTASLPQPGAAYVFYGES